MHAALNYAVYKTTLIHTKYSLKTRVTRGKTIPKFVLQ